MTIDEPDPGCPSTTRHGDRAASQHHGCTCPAARAAATRYTKEWRLAQLRGDPWLVPALGPRRRLQALYAAGWPAIQLAPMLGLTSKRSMDRLVRPTMMRRGTAARICAVYEELSGRPGPSRKTAGAAAFRGYAPPLAWDDIDDPAAVPWTDVGGAPEVADPVVLARLFAGIPVAGPLAEVDARAFTAAAAGAGWSSERIAARTGVGVRVVRRWRTPAWAGPPKPRTCEWCGEPIPYDPAQPPSQYRQRRYHEGECRMAGQAKTLRRTTGLGVAS